MPLCFRRCSIAFFAGFACCKAHKLTQPCGLSRCLDAILWKRGDRLWLRDRHARSANRAVHPSCMFHHGRDRPELSATLRALDVNDMHQLGTLIKRIYVLIAYQRIDPPDNSMSVIFC